MLLPNNRCRFKTLFRAVEFSLGVGGAFDGGLNGRLNVGFYLGLRDGAGIEMQA